jgi:prepilin-type processing-associated H-X9-DG protein
LAEGFDMPGRGFCGLTERPFGYNGAPTLPPKKLSAVNSARGRGLSSIWAIVDADMKGNPGSGAAQGGSIAPVPAHGSARNYLWFDSHVESVRVPSNGKYADPNP